MGRTLYYYCYRLEFMVLILPRNCSSANWQQRGSLIICFSKHIIFINKNSTQYVGGNGVDYVLISQYRQKNDS